MSKISGFSALVLVIFLLACDTVKIARVSLPFAARQDEECLWEAATQIQGATVDNGNQVKIAVTVSKESYASVIEVRTGSEENIRVLLAEVRWFGATPVANSTLEAAQLREKEILGLLAAQCGVSLVNIRCFLRDGRRRVTRCPPSDAPSLH